MLFKFMQPVSTPRGNGFFIALLTDGTHCQVAIKERGIQRNPIFQLNQISEPKKKQSSEAENEPVSQVAEA